MPLDPKCQILLDMFAGVPKSDFDTLDAATYRQMMDNPMPAPKADVAHVEDVRIPVGDGMIGARIYHPRPGAVLPGLVFYHGGGFVIGTLDTHDGLCRALARAADCAVVSVDYRLAPEHPFPTPVEDAYAAKQWVAANASDLGLDPGRIAVGGDSAGGNLAAVVAQLSAARGSAPLVHQLLFYPVTDCSFDTSSYRDNAEGYFLTAEMMRWFWRQYVGELGRGLDPLASPLRAEISSDLAPATVVTAEYDPLRDEGEAYAARLREAGIPVTLRRFDGVIHGFASMLGVVDQADEAVRFGANALRKAFAEEAIAVV